MGLNLIGIGLAIDRQSNANLMSDRHRIDSRLALDWYRLAQDWQDQGDGLAYWIIRIVLRRDTSVGPPVVH